MNELATISKHEIATITKLEQIRIAIEEVRTFEEIKNINDRMVVFYAYIETSKLSSDIQDVAAEILMRSNRKLGEFSLGLDKKSGGDRKSKNQKLPPETFDKGKIATLASLGISRKKAFAAEKMAKIPDKEFEATIAAAKAATQRITKSLFVPAEAEKKAKENSQAQFRVEEYWRTGKKPKGWIDGSDDELYQKAKESAARHEAGQNELAERKTEAAQYQDDPFPAQFEKYLAGLDTDTHRIVVCNSVMKICRSTLAKARK
jgi:hypothetical protein